jgi:hypothetical protein
MPSCFQLLDKQSNEAVSLNKLDEDICKDVLNVPVHEKKYGGGYVKGAFNWFDTIGYHIATGMPLGSQELRDHYLKSDIWAEEAPIISKILDYLEARYYSHSFYGR